MGTLHPVLLMLSASIWNDLTVAQTNNLVCPEGWAQHPSGKCFLMVSDPAPWELANTTCYRNGGKLVEPAPYAQNDYIGGLAATYSVKQFWIGYNRRGFVTGSSVDGQWSDGRPEMAYFGHWGHGNPDVAAGECVYAETTTSSPLWYFDQCSLPKSYACEIPACPKDSFQCVLSDRCVSTADVCNGVDNCGDGSDEASCAETCSYVVEDTDVDIESPNFPNQYGNSQTCQWTLVGPVGSRIELQFSSFNTEEDVDVVEIRVGGQTLSTTSRLALLSGRNLDMSETYVSSNNLMIIRFKTDNSVSAAGFSASWSTSFTCGMMKLAGHRASNFPRGVQQTLSLSSTQGVAYCESLCLNQACALFTYQRSNRRCTLADQLTAPVEDGGSDVYVKRCPDQIGDQPSPQLPSSGRALVAVSTSRQMGTPFYPVQLPGGLWVIYTIEAESEFTITVELLDNDVGPQDYLLIYDGDSTRAPVLARFTSDSQKETVVSTSRIILIHIRTETVTEGRGFLLSYRQGCNMVLYQESGLISSPGYSSRPYPSQTVCTWHISNPLPRPLTLRFLSPFDLETDKDYVQVYQGVSDRGQAQHPGPGFTGQVLPTATLTTQAGQQGQFYVRMITGTVGNGVGFSARFSSDCPQVDSGSKNIQVSPANASAGFGVVIRVQCSGGSVFTEAKYRGQPSVTVTCLLGGTWDQTPFPECAPVFCGQIPAVTNGFIIFNGGFYSGNNVRYQCAPGYNLIGSNLITCQNDGNWSSPPSCTATSCPALPPITNGRYVVLYGSGTTFSTVVEIRCEAGYEVVGLARLVCGQGNAWSGSPPTCQKRLCNIPELENGVTLNRGRTYAAGDSVQVQCNAGYRVKGLNPYRCAVDDYPTCEDIDECVSGISGCQQGCVNTPGGFQCTCYSGYRQNVNQTNVCLNINECDEGYCRQGCVDTEGSYSCQCDAGYELYRTYGQRGRFLLGEDGTQIWHLFSINHTCIRLPCPTRPLTMINGRVLSSQTTFLYGDTIQYLCNMGYKMSGSPVSTCQSNGAWDFAVPTCTAITCPPAVLPTENPATPSKLGSAVHRETVQYTCTLPNGVQQVRKRQCLYDKETDTYRLIGDSLTCPVIDCGPPMQISGSLPYTLTSTIYPAQFTFTCRGPLWVIKGSSSQQDNIIRCESDGKWDYGSLSCDGPTCLDPGRPLDGLQVATSYEEYSLVHWNCLRPGYQPDPPTPIMCMYNASATPVPLSWNGSVPVCVDVEKPVFTNCPTEVILTQVHKSPGFPVPVAQDNSGAIASTRTSPTNFSPFIPVSTDLEVTYYATDHASNTATCIIYIKIQDELPPDISGPSSVHVEITSATQTVTVNPSSLGWTVSGEEYPTSLYFDPPYLNLTKDDIGRIHYITGTAEDRTGNTATSRIQVAVTGTKCRPWSLVVRRGTAFCLPKSAPQVGYICDIRCDPGYGFYENINIEELRMECDEGQDWNRNVPECVALHYPVYRQEFQLHYPRPSPLTGQGCNNLYTQQLTTGVTPLMDTFTQTVCKDVKPAVTVSLVTRGLNVTVVSTSAGGQEIRVRMSLEIGPKRYDNRPYTTCAAYIFRAFNQPQLQHLSNITPLNPNQQNGCPTLQMQFDGMAYNDFECVGHEEFRERTDYPRTYCLECPLGYYTEDRRVCIPCKANTYRETPAADSCPACPVGSRSTTVGARSIDECSRRCPHGMVSPLGVAPCNECPVNTYSLNTTYCAPCPSSTFTRGPGKGSRGDCIQQCAPGFYSVDGLQPCTRCLLNTYQPNPRQTKCIACPDTQHTSSTGSTTLTACVNSYQKLCLSPNPCVRGICRVAYYDYYCTNCPSGYTGRHCEEFINPCASNPCHNGGTCILSLLTFRCDCPPGSSGDLCEFQRDDCVGHQCRNGGVCQDALNSYNCLCPSYSGYSGTRCTSLRQPCNVFPCLAGTCTPYDNIRRKCFCSAGFIGDSCSVNIDECASAPCLHGGTCIDDTNTFRCDCPAGYSGKFCEIRDNVCAASTCGANGECVDIYVDGVTQCICNQNFKDSNGVCSVINQCDSSPCQNEGVCSSHTGGYTCTCPVGFTGHVCQHNIDDCSSNPCLHDGICIDKVNGYECLCTKPDTGRTNCEDTKDNCSPFPCDPNHSPSCTDLYNDYRCICQAGWTGKNCSEMVEDLCAKSPCQHNSVCRNTALGSYTCDCKVGWTGRNCESPVDLCVNNQCQNNAVCVNTIVGFYCRCPLGFRGDRCETRYDVCLVANHCVGKDSQCQVINGEAECSCSQGQSGEGCELQEQVCKPTTCLNGATCYEQAGRFSCGCVPGYTGSRCEAEVDECATVSCPAGHFCVDGLDSFKCRCPDGKFGETCNKDIPYTGDLVFVPHLPTSGETVDSGDPLLINSTGLTVSFWVRYTGQGRFFPGTILTLYGLNTPDISGPKTQLLQLDGGKARVSFSGDDRLLPNAPQNIADGFWHHVVLTWDGNSGSVRLFIDKNPVNTVSPYGRGRRLPQYGWIVLGGQFDPDTETLRPNGQFEGKLSRVEVIPRALSYPAEITRLADQTPPSPNGLVGFSDGLLTDPDASLDYQGELTRNICKPGLECSSNTNDSTAVKLVSCPDSQVVVGENRVGGLTWMPPVFNNSYNITSTYDLGDDFVWGTHYVTYIATDQNGEAATCTVRLVYRRRTCEETEPDGTAGGRVTCTDIPQGRLCRVSCTIYKEDLSQESPQYYTCNVYTMWGSDEKLVPFQLPACAKTEDRLVNALVRVEYTFTRDCGSVEASLKSNLRAAFSDINSDWSSGLCNAATCDAVPIHINCTGQYMEATFNAISDPLTSASSSGTLKSPDVILREQIIDQDKLDFQTSSGSTPVERTLEVILVPYCPPGTQLIGDSSCVECGAGMYYNNDTGRCQACDKGFYQELSAQFVCVRCGPGTTTPGTGTQSRSQCYETCPPGEYYSLSQDRCMSCPLGNYQNGAGLFYCIPCPLGRTTIDVKSTSSEQCIDDSLIFESTTSSLLTVAPPSTGESTGGSGLSDGVIAAIILAILIFLLLLILLLLCCCRDRLAVCFPCCATGGKVKPEQGDKWRYVSRYGASNDKFVNYRLSDVREKNKVSGGLPQTRWTFQEDKAALMRDIASEGSQTPPQVASSAAPISHASPTILPALQTASIADESPKRRKKKSKKHRRHHRTKESRDTLVASPPLAVTQNSGKGPVALPPIPSNELGNPMMTSFAYCFERTPSGHYQHKPKTEVASVHYGDYVMEKQTSTPRSLPMRNGDRIMVDSEEEDYR